jgi:hypothetical protein
MSIDAGNNGRIYGVFREMKVSQEEVKELWYDAVPLPTDDDSDPNIPKHLIECCVYSPSPDFRDRDWVFCVFDPEKSSR